MAINDEEPDYFLGSIVVTKNGTSYQVFDGQQRLATTVILLAAIRDYWEEIKDVERATIIERTYLKASDLKSLDENPNLHLSAVDHDFYLKRILNKTTKIRKETKPEKVSHERIDKAAQIAAKQVRDLVAGLPQSVGNDILNDWVNFLEEKATVICVQVQDDSNAYIVFETMNDRGLRPSAADLLKNHLFGLAADRQEEAEKAWTLMTGALDTIPDVEDDMGLTYIRHLWIAKHGPTRTKELFDKIKKEIKGKSAAVTLTRDLAASAPKYAALLNPTHDMWNPYGTNAKRNIQILDTLGAEQIRPLLLSGITKFTKEEVRKLLAASVCWTVRLLINGVSGSGALEGQFGRAAKGVYDGEIETTNGVMKKLTAILPDDEAFLSAFSLCRIGKSHLGIYYLRALQREKDGEEEPQYVPNDGADINLEHILPKSPSFEWNLDLDQDELSAISRRLGNIVLLQSSENQKNGNLGYAKKKATLHKSAFSLTKMASEHTQWGKREINERQVALAKLAVKTWPLQP